ncbi:type I-B CRISPR-associated protein Cas5b [Bacillus cereus]|uniref:CRISPR-associated protein n=1 Tax=Bacillus cereus TaxID=1396 RepID=A0A161SWA3_BACCE|nr:type I-B CRISPR-associated protein Cas5b [Bacillus cereus]KZD71915.1 CRISPR-associated protein [Bacillus cereus]
MKTLKVRLNQESASYTKPFAFKVGETYPLPPYSTLIGFLHRAGGFTSYNEMKVSVQGEYESKFSDYRTTYLYKKKETTFMPLHVHYLYNVQLVIHIAASEDVLEKLFDALKYPRSFLSLGRREDIVRIDEVKWVETRKTDEDITTEYDMYLPVSSVDEEDRELFKQAKYRLNTTYQIIDDQRVWDTESVWYVSKGTLLNTEEVTIDDDGDLVLLNG